MFLIHLQKFNYKPTSYEVALIQNTWNNNSIYTDDISVLVKALSQGQTIKFNIQKSNSIIIDADNPKINVIEALNKLEKINLLPMIAYSSFSANETKNNFRLIYFFDNEIIKEKYISFTNLIEQILNIKLDYAFANNPKQICYGTNKKIYVFNQSITDINKINLPEINLVQIKKNTPLHSPNSAPELVELEQLNYKDFVKELNKILEDKKHIGYDLCLRWCFANFTKPELQEKILYLSSSNTQYKVRNLLKTKPKNYLIRLVANNSNFYKIYISNQKNKNKLKKII